MNFKVTFFISVIVLIESQNSASSELFQNNDDAVNETFTEITSTELPNTSTVSNKSIMRSVGTFDKEEPSVVDELAAVITDTIHTFLYGHDRDHVHFHLYTRSNPQHGYQLFAENLSTQSLSLLNPRYTTKIIIHGLKYSENSTFTQLVKDAYILDTEENVNIITVGWGKLGLFPWYIRAVVHVTRVGTHVAKFVDAFVNAGYLKLANLHIIGFSLGAHIAGVVGKHIESPGKIARITGLDPAGPFMEKHSRRKNVCLSSDDAILVDIIHTNAGILGVTSPVGHVDFYVNEGSTQPNCTTPFCSHSRAWILWIESIKHKYSFPTTACESFKSPMLNPHHTKCNLCPYHTTYMGEYLNYEKNLCSARIFKLNTTSSSQYRVKWD